MAANRNYSTESIVFLSEIYFNSVFFKTLQKFFFIYQQYNKICITNKRFRSFLDFFTKVLLGLGNNINPVSYVFERAFPQMVRHCYIRKWPKRRTIDPPIYTWRKFQKRTPVIQLEYTWWFFRIQFRVKCNRDHFGKLCNLHGEPGTEIHFPPEQNTISFKFNVWYSFRAIS